MSRRWFARRKTLLADAPPRPAVAPTGCDECFVPAGECHEWSCPTVSVDEFRAFLNHSTGGPR